MPQSRKRPGHSYQKPADIPARQRTSGRIVWSLLAAIFGLLITFFAGEGRIAVMIVGTLIGGTVGYIVGKIMEKNATEK